MKRICYYFTRLITVNDQLIAQGQLSTQLEQIASLNKRPVYLNIQLKLDVNFEKIE